MPAEPLHRFRRGDRNYVVDTETCFCFECDAITWDVLDYYPNEPINAIVRILGERYDPNEIREVVGELEWLRNTKSVLTEQTGDGFDAFMKVERGLRRVSVAVNGAVHAETRARTAWFGRAGGNSAPPSPVVAAGDLLLGRSQEQRDLTLFVDGGEGFDETSVSRAIDSVFDKAKLAGKNLTVTVSTVADRAAAKQKSLSGHSLRFEVDLTGREGCETKVRALAQASKESISRAVKILDKQDIVHRAVLRPGSTVFADAVEALDHAGFPFVTLDLDGAFCERPELNTGETARECERVAAYYAQRLVNHHYFRLDPMAAFFWRIYNGMPQPRADWAGTQELAVDADGAVYPSRLFAAQEVLRLGSVGEGLIDEDRLTQFEDVGSLTTAPCVSCWAKNLCGGGTAAVHYALSGDYRKPHPEWCAAQRQWMESAIAAFNHLSASGVNFTRLYGALGKTAKPSLFNLVRAATKMSIGIRPIEEADAERLARWESWRDASYFLLTEGGYMISTVYEREMDALHPKPGQQELLLLRKDGDPFGLVKFRPERDPGVAQAWVFMLEPSDYGAGAIQKSFRFLLNEAAEQQNLERLLVGTAVYEEPLHAFLSAVGFHEIGVQREALFCHGKYHDAPWFAFDVAQSK